jgi:hypothetical protein
MKPIPTSAPFYVARLTNKKAEAEASANHHVTGLTRGDQRAAPALVLLSAEFSVSYDFLASLCLGRDSANGRLSIVERRYRVYDPITPDIRTKFRERESRIFFDHALAQVWPELSRLTLLRGARAQIQIADGRTNLFREFFSLGWSRDLEVGFEVHSVRIDHSDLFEQIFLHVDQYDHRGYPFNHENM